MESLFVDLDALILCSASKEPLFEVFFFSFLSVKFFE